MEIPRHLKDQLRVAKVIPFVGAGVSKAVKTADGGSLFPTWKALLEAAADRLDQEKKDVHANIVRSLLQLNTPDYLEAARRARDGLGPLWFVLLKEELDHAREAAHAGLELAQSIWGLKSRLVITTNYDKVLQWACPQRDDVAIWDIEAPAEQSGAIRGDLKQPTVWHLHGHIGNAASIILTPDGYSRLYPGASGGVQVRYEAALATLRYLTTSHTLLFVGFSLDDAYLGMELRGVNEIFQGTAGPHYILTRETGRERIEALNLPVELVPVAGYGSPLVEGVLELGEIAAERESASRTELEVERVVRTTHVATYNPGNPVFYVPYRAKGDQVVGREATICLVREQLTCGRRTAIGQTAAFEGLGGLGKTQLAVEYAYRYREEYPNGVIWLNADQDIDSQLTDLAEKARWIAPESEHKHKLEIAQQRLRTYSDCLVIYDNVESVALIENYLPNAQASPHILITSRTEQTGFTPVPLELLHQDLSVALLLQEAGQNVVPAEEGELRALREVARTLDGLPLALELAGAYIRYRRLRWQQYRDLLNHSLKDALPAKFLEASFTRHEKDIYTTLRINEAVLGEEPRLREILDLLTWSGSAPMGAPLMCALLGVQSITELTGALGLATALRVLQKSPDAEIYTIHRLVREVRREEVSLSGREEWVSLLCGRVGDWFQGMRESFKDLPRFEAESDHLQAWQRHALQHAPDHASRLTWLQAYPPDHRGHYAEAKEWLEKALKVFDQTAANDLHLRAHLSNDLGHIYGQLGDYNRALEYLEGALTIRKELLGERHADTAVSFNNVGDSFGRLGDQKRALEYQKKALAIRVELFGENHADTATSFNDLGNTYGELGDDKRALEYHEKALHLRRRLLGERDPDTAESFLSVGVFSGALGDKKRALEYKKKALEVDLELFGELNPNTARDLFYVGAAHSDLGDPRRGFEYSNRTLKIRLELYGENHPDTARSYLRVGDAYAALGDHVRAVEQQRKAMALLSELLGDLHPDTLVCANNLAQSLSVLERRTEAYDLIDRLFRKLPRDHQHYRLFERRKKELTKEPLHRGFRQPQSNPKKRKKAKRKTKKRR